MENKISVILIINNDEVYNKFAKQYIEQSFNDVSISLQIIKVFNYNNTFKNIVECYNQGINKATGEYILFVHPDTMFLKNNEFIRILKRTIKIFNDNNEIKIIGLQGVSFDLWKHQGTIVDNTNVDKKDDIQKNVLNENLYFSQTLDPVFFIIKKEDLLKYSFSNYINTFHLAVEDLCLRIIENNGKIVTIDSYFYHHSKGNSFDEKYYEQALIILKKRKHILLKLKAFNTSCMYLKVNNYYFAKIYLIVRIITVKFLKLIPRNIKDNIKNFIHF